MKIDERRRDEALRELIDNITDHPFGIITQNGYYQLQNKFRRWFIIGLVAFSLIGVTTITGLVGFAYVINQIKKNRVDFIRTSCENSNLRNRNTVATLTKLSASLAKDAPTEAERRRIQQSLPPTILLINALSPVQDCDMVVRAAQGETTSLPSGQP